MSRLLDVPFALASDGTLLLGMTWTDGAAVPHSCLERALRSGGRVFIGVELNADEAARVITSVHDGFEEAAASIAGARRAARP